MDMHNTAFRQDLYRYQTEVNDTCLTSNKIIESIQACIADFYAKMSASEIIKPNSMRLHYLGNRVIVSAEVYLSELPIKGKILCRLEQSELEKPILLKTTFDFDTIGNINATLGPCECAHMLMQQLFAELKEMKCVIRE